MKMEQCVPKRRHIKFRRRGITQKKAYNITLNCCIFSFTPWPFLSTLRIDIMWQCCCMHRQSAVLCWVPVSVDIDSHLRSFFCTFCFGSSDSSVLYSFLSNSESLLTNSIHLKLPWVLWGLVMARAVVASFSPLTCGLYPVPVHVGICGRQSITGAGFSASASVFPCQCHFTGIHTNSSIYRQRYMNLAIMYAVTNKRDKWIPWNSAHCERKRADTF